MTAKEMVRLLLDVARDYDCPIGVGIGCESPLLCSKRRVRAGLFEIADRLERTAKRKAVRR